MGSRYGRNQKRKHIETIAKLSEQKELLREDSQKMERKYIRLENQVDEWNDEIIHILGRYTALRKDLYEIAVKQFHELQKLPAPEEFVSMTFDMSSIQYLEQPIPIRLIKFLLCLSNKDLMDFKRIVSVRITDERKQVCIAINAENLHLMKNDPKAFKYIVENLSKQLAAAL